MGKSRFQQFHQYFMIQITLLKFLWVVLPGWGRLYLFRYNSQILEA